MASSVTTKEEKTYDGDGANGSFVGAQNLETRHEADTAREGMERLAGRLHSTPQQRDNMPSMQILARFETLKMMNPGPLNVSRDVEVFAALHRKVVWCSQNGDHGWVKDVLFPIALETAPA